MATTGQLRALMLPFIVSCALVGGYGTMVLGSKNGFFEIITNTAGRRKEAFISGGVHPLKTTYTGIPAVDSQLMALIGFFAYSLDLEQSWDVTLSFWYLMAQFFAAWCLLLLEGVRKGNAGRAASWTGTLGAVFQNASYTLSVPLYLVMHILTSPTALPTTSLEHVLPGNPLEGTVLPVSALIAFVIPSILMALPAPSVLSAAAHYTWIALWQPFPIWQTVLHWTFRRLYPASSSQNVRRPGTSVLSTATVYRFVLCVAVASHLAYMSLALLPASALPEAWSTLSTLLEHVTFRTAFIPAWFSSGPTVDPNLSPLPAAAVSQLAKYFFQWDIYGGNTGILLWAIYLRRAAEVPSKRSGWATLLGKVLCWVAIGGLTAPAAVLLWERDEMLARRPSEAKKES